MCGYKPRPSPQSTILGYYFWPSRTISITMAEGYVAIEILYEIEREQQRENRRRERNVLRLHRRHLRDMFNPFDMSETAFRDVFRLSRRGTLELINSLRPLVAVPRRRHGIPLDSKVCGCTFTYLWLGLVKVLLGSFFYSYMAYNRL